jgi:hypothetical protein
MKPFFKLVNIVLLVTFWSITWHCYALSAIRDGELISRSDSRIEKSRPDAGSTSENFEKKKLFKRRPFIAKKDIIPAAPEELFTRLYVAYHDASKIHFLLPYHTELFQQLRSPPSLF